MLYLLLQVIIECVSQRLIWTRGGGALSSNGLLGMCRWMGHIFTTRQTIMGSPFQALSIELLERGRTFSGH